MNIIRLVALAKNEGAYLAEWVHHHFYFGFDEICIVLNECDDNSLELLKKISNENPRLIIRNGDILKDKINKNGGHFQVSAYAEELQLARMEGRVTHLMCLDIDEFWVSKNLNESIHDYINRYPNADSIAFSWFMEVPTNPPPFKRALELTYPVQRDSHVKSIHRLSDRLTYLDIHNAKHNDGVYIFANGCEFPDYEYNDSNRASLPFSLFDSVASIIDPAFIYHRIFRSQMEYLSSLQRGRADVNNNDLKTNRWGYRSQNSNTPILLIEHSIEALNSLSSDYDRFVSTNNLYEFIEVARLAVVNRSKKTLSFIADSGEELSKHLYLFNCITLDDVHKKIPPDLIFHIDSVTRSEGRFLIKGWVADRNSDRVISVASTCGVVNLNSISRMERPDVNSKFPGVDPFSGFYVDVKEEKLSDSINLKFICDSYVLNHLVNLKENF
jgi:hypothetical protein